MSPSAKITWSIIVVLVAVVAIASQLIHVRQSVIELTQHTLNTGELTRETLVGQTLTAPEDNLAGIGVMFATFSNRNNTEPVELHIRESIQSTQDLRVVTVDPKELGDNQFHQFAFEPIPDSKGKQYFFYLVSPTSSPGNAVTVDVNTQDPYHEGTAYIVRGQGPQVTNPIILARSGKQGTDVVFRTYHSVTIRTATINTVRNAYATFVTSWDEEKSAYFIWSKMVAVALLFFLVLWIMQSKKTYETLSTLLGRGNFIALMLFLLLLAGIGLRYWYADQLPVTNDEGNYLYDARSLREGILAGGDGYVKAPLVILWISLWQIIGGNTIIAGRFSSIVIGALTLFPLYLLAKTILGGIYIKRKQPKGEPEDVFETDVSRRIGITVAAVWALFGAAIVNNVYVHTQPVALFFGVSGLAFLAASLRNLTPRLTFILGEKKLFSAPGWFVFAGMLLGLGVASRKSILALGLVPLVLIMAESKGVKNRLLQYLYVGIGFSIVIIAFLATAYAMYGKIGIQEAIGLNSAEDGITGEDIDPEVVREYSLKGMTPFFRESLPLILLSLLGWGFAGERLVLFIYTALQKTKHITVTGWDSGKYAASKAMWLFPWLAFSWMWSFFFEYEGEVFFGYGIRELWYFFGLVLLVATVWPEKQLEEVPDKDKEKNAYLFGGPNISPVIAKPKVDFPWRKMWWRVSAFVIGPLWIGGLAFFYMNWIKFHANYISEFIPPFVLLAGFGAFELYRRFSLLSSLWLQRVAIAVVSLGVIWAIAASNFITYTFEHTGTFDQAAVEEAAQWARDNIPLEQPIFTGAALIPYLSGHHVSLDIAHPRWYAYEFTRKDTARISTFLPPVNEMLEAYRNANFFLRESQTGFSFLMEYSEIEGGLQRDWQEVKSIENGSNTLIYYQRIKK